MSGLLLAFVTVHTHTPDPIFIFSCFLTEHGTPTSVAFVASDPNQVVVSFDGGETLLYDLNTEQSITALETQTKDGME